MKSTGWETESGVRIRKVPEGAEGHAILVDIEKCITTDRDESRLVRRGRDAEEVEKVSIGRKQKRRR